MIAGRATEYGRGPHIVRYDEVNDEFVTVNMVSQAILTFRGGANGNEPPIRIIQGSNTRYNGSDKLDVDTIHNEMFVSNEDAILVFPRTAQGNVAPLRVIEGPETGLKNISAVVVDPVNNVVVVHTGGGGGESEAEWTGSFLDEWISQAETAEQQQEQRPQPREQRFGALRIFNRTDKGNVKPLRVIEGPNVPLVGVNQMQSYPPKGWIVASLRPRNDNYFAGIWSIHDQGNVPPRWLLGDLPSGLHSGRTVALVPQHKEVVVTAYDSEVTARILRFSFPEIF